MTEMEKTYDPKTIEQRWYQTWEERGYFAPHGQGDPFCIMIPPPNVTGSLHMGHAFQDTLMDALTRYHRMKGDNTLWQVGTDHAGIATQMVVERHLHSEGQSRHGLGRQAFVEAVWRWKSESGGTITQQLRRMGASVDWSRERFTMDEGLSEAVKEVFVRLHEEGLIYRGKRLVNWDPVLRTAVSDLEVVSQEEDGQLWHMRYPLVDGTGELVVATTRPETMLGDAAVAVHPGDERYKHLLGQMVELPLTGRHIPIIADEYVDPEFGSGCVKITPAHDFNDYQVWLRHRDTTELQRIPHNGLLNIFTPAGQVKAKPEDDTDAGDNPSEQTPVCDLLPSAYRGQDRFDARTSIVADLEALGLLAETEKHRLMVPRGDRTGTVIEPYLTNQWFVQAKPLAEPATRVVENGDIRFVPDNWKNTYYEWMRNIQDWCISRQIWWGHRIPAWYDDQGDVYVGRSEDEVRKQHGLGAEVPLRQDEDVLDTWFSSALWPFSTLGWPNDTAELRTFYPTSVLVTGFDIIFFWVARMIMMGLKFTGDVPFREVYIHGLVRDAYGQKMSKSKGNVLDPIDLIDGIDLESLIDKRTSGLMQPEMASQIEKHTREEFPEGIPAFGADALRFTFAALATRGRDIKFDLGRIEGYRNFCNKLWNAARYVLMNTESQDTGLLGEETELTLADRWILARLQYTIDEVRETTESYRFDQAAQAMYEFFWNHYCDWYLELSKPVLQDPDSPEAKKRGTRQTLVQVLEQALRVMHPIMPFITEEIWQKIAPLAGCSDQTIMLRPYPETTASLKDQIAVEEMEWIQDFIIAVRTIRGEMDIAPSQPVPVKLRNWTNNERQRVEHHRSYITTLARVAEIEWLQREAEPSGAATGLVGEVELFIPMAGLIDKEAELARLNKQLDKLRKDLERSENKLSNPNFVEKAPEDVVSKEQNRVEELRSSLTKLEEQRQRVASL